MGFKHAWDVLTGIDAVNQRHKAEMDMQQQAMDIKNKELELKDKQMELDRENVEKNIKNEREKHKRELEYQKNENEKEREKEQTQYVRGMENLEKQRNLEKEKYIESLNHEAEKNAKQMEDSRGRYREGLESQERCHDKQIELERKINAEKMQLERDKIKEESRKRDKILDLEWARIGQYALEQGKQCKNDRVVQIQENIRILRDIMKDSEGEEKRKLQSRILEAMDKIDKVQEEVVKIPKPSWKEITE